MKHIRTIFLLITGLSILGPASSHCQRFQNLNADFPMAAAEELFQDAEGFLWIGTMSGLVRFDGYRTQVFTHDPNDSLSIAANNINAIGQDQYGRIWVGISAYGLDILDSELKAFKHVCLRDSVGTCMEHITVNDLAPDGEQHVWVGSTMGLFRFHIDTPSVSAHAFYHDQYNPYSLSSSYILQTFVDSRNRLWVGTAQGINLYDKEKARFTNHRVNSTFPSVQILDIDEDREGKIWVAPRFTEERLIVYDENRQEFIAFPEFHGRRYGEFKIAFDRNNDLWVSSRGMGAFHFDRQTQQQTYFDPATPQLHGFVNDNSITALCDRFGNIWMAGNHLMQWPATGKAILHVDTDERSVISVYANKESIWFCDSEPRRFDHASGDVHAFLPSYLPTQNRPSAGDSPVSRRIYKVDNYDTGHVIMSSTRNIYIWNVNTGGFREFPLDYGGPFRDFLLTEDKNFVWICGNQGSPILLNLRTGEASRPEYTRTIRNPRRIVQGTNGDIWFGSSTNGIYRLIGENAQVENFSPDHQDITRRLTDYNVNDIVFTDSAVWVATNLGINIIDNASHRLTYLRKHGDFKEESVMSMLADHTGDIWMGTQQGIVRYSPAGKHFTHYDQSDGLINAVYSRGACYKDSDDNLYFGGDKGVDFFNPAKIGTNSIQPVLYISKILVNNVSIDTTLAPHHLQNVTLSHKENFIEIELLALHLTAPESNRYAYHIPELDTVWRDLGTQRTITLANMRPGTYTLQARAANADGVWCTDKTLLKILIKSPFWATWWFIAGCVIFASILLALVYRVRIRQIETQEKLRTEFNKRIAELESTALRAQMNPHFLFNSINSVKSLISQGNSDKATQYLTRFGQLIRQVLANSEKSFVRLQEEIKALRLYLEIEQLRFQNFTYVINVEEGVNADFIEVPPLILQPYVENAIWHGLMHKVTGDRKLWVSVARSGDFLHMIVEDNGVGREKAKQMRILGNMRKGGMGMRLTSDRLKLLQAVYGQDVSIHVEDLKDHGRASGTRVEIRIPCME